VIVLLGLLGRRVSEACAVNLEDLGFEHGHRVRSRTRKGRHDGMAGQLQ
jgi:hypothetical protein